MHWLCMHLEVGSVNLSSLRDPYSAEVGKVYTELAFNSHRQPDLGSGKVLESWSDGWPAQPAHVHAWPVGCGLWPVGRYRMMLRL